MREAIEENRSLISRFTFCPECRADQLSPKEGCADLLSFSASQLNFIATQLNFIANHLNVIASFLNLDATVVFHLLAFVYCLLFTFFSAEAVLGTTEAVSTKLLAEAV